MDHIGPCPTGLLGKGRPGKVRVASLASGARQTIEPDPLTGVNRMYICSCFGITEEQVREHADTGACTPRQIASACKAGTDCGSCVRRIQALLGRGAYTPQQAQPRIPEPAPLTAEAA